MLWKTMTVGRRAGCLGGIAGILVAFGAAPAFASEYRLVTGQGYTVCEAFMQHLAGRDEHNPMLCRAELDPAHPGFTRPDWQALSLEEPENLALFRQLDQIARAKHSSPVNHKRVGALSAAEWLADFEWRRQQPDLGEPRLLKAKLGLDGQGDDETVVAITWGLEQCQSNLTNVGYMDSWGPYTIFEFDEERQHVDLEATDGHSLGRSQEHDVVIFQGRAFFLTSYLFSDHYAELYLQQYGHYPFAQTATRCKYQMNLAEPRGDK